MKPKSLTLREIDERLVEAIELVERATTEAEIEQAQALVVAWVEHELAKVDRIRDYLRHCEITAKAAREEAAYQRDRAGLWANRAKNLKSLCQVIMERRGVTRLEGHTGTLLLRSAGGREAVEVNNADLVPVGLRRYEVNVIGDRAEMAIRAMMTAYPEMDVGWTSEPRLTEIAAKLAAGEAVAGCNLADRGKYVEVK